MPTLHIEHVISDFDVWQEAFKRFDGARQQAGVRSYQVRRPVDDAHYVVIDLDFDTVEQAERFRNFLHQNVWSSPSNSPALVGPPETKILQMELSSSPAQPAQ
jgi:hypothetical protein